VIQRAAELVASTKPVGQLRIEDTLADLPKNDQKTKDHREALFKLQSTRQKLLFTAKEVTDTQHSLAKSLVGRINQDPDKDSKAAMDPLIKELALLDQVRGSIKNTLADSALNETGVKFIDNLLALVPADESYGTLYILTDEQMFKVLPDQAGETDVTSQSQQSGNATQELQADPEWVASQILVDTNITIDFLGGMNLNEVQKHDDVMFLRANKTPAFKNIQTTEPIRGEAIVDGSKLQELDEECTQVRRSSRSRS